MTGFWAILAQNGNRGGLLITVEGPARVAAENLTFDLDQVEVLRS